jgi:hypothetical protein
VRDNNFPLSRERYFMDSHLGKKVQILATHCSCSGYHVRHAWLSVAVGARWSPLERDSRMIERQVGKWRASNGDA